MLNICTLFLTLKRVMGEIAQLIESRAENSQHETAESKRNKQSDCQSILIARSFPEKRGGVKTLFDS